MKIIIVVVKDVGDFGNIAVALEDDLKVGFVICFYQTKILHKVTQVLHLNIFQPLPRRNQQHEQGYDR